MEIGVHVTFDAGALRYGTAIRELLNYGPVAAKDLEGVQEVLRMFNPLHPRSQNVVTSPPDNQSSSYVLVGRYPGGRRKEAFVISR